MNEADTCRKYILPKLVAAGWDNSPHSFTEQKTFTDGRIVLIGNTARRKSQKRADYLLRYMRDYAIAVVEAKAEYKEAGDGMQQAKDYAAILDLPFAYASNGISILEFDAFTGIEREIADFPTPRELWTRLCFGRNITVAMTEQLLSPYNLQQEKIPRYYQDIAINRSVQEILQGQKRILLTLATGTGKTDLAFQLCWKLWSSRWNRAGEYRRPKILYLADRNMLVDDPKDKTFLPFGDARFKIEGGVAPKSREMYFAIYQAVAADENRLGLYKSFSPDFFDLIIVDECHRGSAREESTWREILSYFHSAVQLGMTATPLRNDNIDSYGYFGNPIYQYSLRQGIDDGFLAPYRVHRVITTYDAAGWRPSAGELDRYGRAIPDEEYQTRDFERIISLKARTEAIARHITEFLKKTDRFAKTIVFCVDQEHADIMRRELSNLNADLLRQYPDYVCRVTANEGHNGRTHLSRFQELESRTPAILTTSQMLTTGVDAPTCKVVVLARVINSMTDFKQIIGRGTRVREDYDKLYFSIIDYTQSTRLFADPDFDGFPALITEQQIDEEGNATGSEEVVFRDEAEAHGESLAGDDTVTMAPDPPGFERRKYYYDGGHVEIAAQLVYDIDSEGRQLRVVQYTDYTAEKVRTLYRSPEELQAVWKNPSERGEVVRLLEEKGINFEQLAAAAKQPDADPLDLLCHLAFNAPLRTRRERAERLRKEQRDFFAQFGPQALQIIEFLLQKYTEHGVAQLAFPEALKVPPFIIFGNVMEIAGFFGGIEKLSSAVNQMQELLYAA